MYRFNPVESIYLDDPMGHNNCIVCLELDFTSVLFHAKNWNKFFFTVLLSRSGHRDTYS